MVNSALCSEKQEFIELNEFRRQRERQMEEWKQEHPAKSCSAARQPSRSKSCKEEKKALGKVRSPLTRYVSQHRWTEQP
jgi:hypothetical protein